MINAEAGRSSSIPSTGAIRPPGGYFADNTSKGGVTALTIGLAVEDDATVCPRELHYAWKDGYAMVRRDVRDVELTEEKWLAAMRLNLLGLEGSAWDVAGAAGVSRATKVAMD